MSFLHHLFIPHHTNNQRAKILHPSSWLSLIVFFLVAQVILAQAVRTFPNILGYASAIPPGEIIRLTNQQRQSVGLDPLKEDSQLDQAAAQKAADMFARDYWAHVSPIGTQPWAFISNAGYVYRYAGENLARDFADPASVVQAWMDSPSHRDNLLSSRYSDIGVAVVDGILNGRDTTLVVQMFGTRLASSPSVNTAGSFTVKAESQSLSDIPTPTPILIPTPTPQVAATASLHRQVSPFTLTKYLSIGLISVMVIVLIIDIAVVSKRRMVRWTSKSVAHLIFLAIMLIAIATLLRGQVY